MGKQIETIINRFDGGITNDPRDPAGNTSAMVSNFDILSNPRRMTPYRSSESGDDAAATSQKKNFCVALRSGTDYSLYALGIKSGADTAEILYKNLTILAAGDLDDDDWGNTGNHQSASGTTSFNLFVYYKRVGLIFGAKTNAIWAYDPAGSVAFDEQATTNAITFTTVAQGLVHSKDDILYIPVDNIIIKNNNGVWADSSPALTLPTHYFITSICEYGNQLAIAVAPTSGVGNSRIFLWDRDATLTTLSESIDGGDGIIMVLEEVDGYLIAISQKGGTPSSFVGIPNNIVSFKDRLIFRYYAGNRMEKLMELISGSRNTLKLSLAKQKVDNRLYFMALIHFNGAVRTGVWSFGRSSPSAPFGLVHERTLGNNTTTNIADSLYNFIVVGDYLFASYQLNGGSVALDKTEDTADTYSHNSICETKRFNAGDSSLKKDLTGITVMHEYLPAAGSVTVKYRKDEETSFTTILTNTTDSSISKSAVNIESSGAALPKDYKEIEFQILSTGGAEITGLSFKEEITGKRAYEAIKE